MRPCIWFHVIVSIHLFVACSCQEKQQQNSTEKLRLEWIGEPVVQHIVGPTIIVSAYTDSGNHEGEIQVSIDSIQTNEIKTNLQLDSTYSGDLKTQLGALIGKNRVKSQGLIYKLRVDSHSIGVAKFQENIVNIKGRVKVTYLYDWKTCSSSTFILVFINDHCYKTPTVHELELNTTQVDQMGNPVSHLWIDYVGTDKYTHPMFYSLVNKTANLTGAKLLDGEFHSPYSCGAQAIELGYHMASYDVNEMKCHVIRVDFSTKQATFDRYGHPIGAFTVPADNKNSTDDNATRDKWILSGECDIISGEFGVDYHCKEFQNKAGSVLMFRMKSPVG